jgi:hypothetical protein
MFSFPSIRPLGTRVLQRLEATKFFARSRSVIPASARHEPLSWKDARRPPLPLQRHATPPPLATTDVQSILAKQAMLLRFKLQVCLTLVESFLVSVGAALARSSVASAELNVGSTDVGDEGLYGVFVLAPTCCRLPLSVRTPLRSCLQ